MKFVSGAVSPGVVLPATVVPTGHALLKQIMCELPTLREGKLGDWARSHLNQSFQLDGHAGRLGKIFLVTSGELQAVILRFSDEAKHWYIASPWPKQLLQEYDRLIVPCPRSERVQAISTSRDHAHREHHGKLVWTEDSKRPALGFMPSDQTKSGHPFFCAPRGLRV